MSGIGSCAAKKRSAAQTMSGELRKTPAAGSGLPVTIRKFPDSYCENMSSTPHPALPHAQYARFESIREYEAMLDALVPTTQRNIRIFDKSLSGSYNTPVRCELLKQFLRSNPLNRLFVVLHEADTIERACPRFVGLLQAFSHAAKVRQTPRTARHLYDSFVIFDASHYLHRFHHDHMRYARGLNEIEGTQQLLDRYSELWEASAPYSPASVAGL
jgi:hypothetical protein